MWEKNKTIIKRMSRITRLLLSGPTIVHKHIINVKVKEELCSGRISSPIYGGVIYRMSKQKKKTTNVLEIKKKDEN